VNIRLELECEGIRAMPMSSPLGANSHARRAPRRRRFDSRTEMRKWLRSLQKMRDTIPAGTNCCSLFPMSATLKIHESPRRLHANPTVDAPNACHGIECKPCEWHGPTYWPLCIWHVRTRLGETIGENISGARRPESVE